MYIDCLGYPAVAVADAVSFLFFFDFANAADGSWRSFRYYFLSPVLSNLSSRGATFRLVCLRFSATCIFFCSRYKY